jgi:hypothetical protein
LSVVTHTLIVLGVSWIGQVVTVRKDAIIAIQNAFLFSITSPPNGGVNRGIGLRPKPAAVS